MLREIKPVRHMGLALYKRWFVNADMEVMIWFKNREPVRFQLRYNRRSNEQLLRWDHNNGFTHKRVSSINTVEDDHFDTASIARNFLIASDHIEELLADFIYARLLEHPGQLAIHPVKKPAPVESL